jgi:hypothetical protein
MFQEPGYERLQEQIGSFERVLSSNLLEAEVRSALKREGIKESHSIDLFKRVDWVFPDRPLTRELRDVLTAGFLRGADLWHLACALYLRGSHDSLELLTCDQRQLDVARRLGLITS